VPAALSEYAGSLAHVGGPLGLTAVRWRRAVLQQVMAREGVVDKTTAKRKDISRMQQSRLNQEEKADHAEDNPALSHVVERNIRTIIQLRLRAARERSVQNRIADAITSFSGRMVFVYVHIVWFGVWIVLNTGRVGVRPFDPFPYRLLTIILSTLAIDKLRFIHETIAAASHAVC
jgi:hypothetical protein